MRTASVFDVFNGDADGIIARHQFRLANPCASTLVTGVKRDIALLEPLADDASVTGGDQLYVFDISFDANHRAAAALLDRDVSITWFDHHRADKMLPHHNLKAHINTAADTCTSLIVDKLLDGKYRDWAIVAAFGDNLTSMAYQLAEQAGLMNGQPEMLRQLGEVINYNAYGETIEDLLVTPAELAQQLQSYKSPFDFIATAPVFSALVQNFASDCALAATLTPVSADATVALFVLPDIAWARRVSGSFANRLVAEYPDRFHVIATTNRPGHFTVSLRAPLTRPAGADEIATRFGGGGRKIAAGIGDFPANQLDALMDAVRFAYSRPAQQ